MRRLLAHLHLLAKSMRSVDEDVVQMLGEAPLFTLRLPSEMLIITASSRIALLQANRVAPLADVSVEVHGEVISYKWPGQQREQFTVLTESANLLRFCLSLARGTCESLKNADTFVSIATVIQLLLDNCNVQDIEDVDDVSALSPQQMAQLRAISAEGYGQLLRESLRRLVLSSFDKSMGSTMSRVHVDATVELPPLNDGQAQMLADFLLEHANSLDEVPQWHSHLTQSLDEARTQAQQQERNAVFLVLNRQKIQQEHQTGYEGCTAAALEQLHESITRQSGKMVSAKTALLGLSSRDAARHARKQNMIALRSALMAQLARGDVDSNTVVTLQKAANGVSTAATALRLAEAIKVVIKRHRSLGLEDSTQPSLPAEAKKDLRNQYQRLVVSAATDVVETVRARLANSASMAGPSMGQTWSRIDEEYWQGHSLRLHCEAAVLDIMDDTTRAMLEQLRPSWPAALHSEITKVSPVLQAFLGSETDGVLTEMRRLHHEYMEHVTAFYDRSITQRKEALRKAAKHWVAKSVHRQSLTHAPLFNLGATSAPQNSPEAFDKDHLPPASSAAILLLDSLRMCVCEAACLRLFEGSAESLSMVLEPLTDQCSALFKECSGMGDRDAVSLLAHMHHLQSLLEEHCSTEETNWALFLFERCSNAASSAWKARLETHLNVIRNYRLCSTRPRVGLTAISELVRRIPSFLAHLCPVSASPAAPLIKATLQWIQRAALADDVKYAHLFTLQQLRFLALSLLSLHQLDFDQIALDVYARYRRHLLCYVDWHIAYALDGMESNGTVSRKLRWMKRSDKKSSVVDEGDDSEEQSLEEDLQKSELLAADTAFNIDLLRLSFASIEKASNPPSSTNEDSLTYPSHRIVLRGGVDLQSVDTELSMALACMRTTDTSPPHVLPLRGPGALELHGELDLKKKLPCAWTVCSVLRREVSRLLDSDTFTIGEPLSPRLCQRVQLHPLLSLASVHHTASSLSETSQRKLIQIVARRICKHFPFPSHASGQNRQDVEYATRMRDLVWACVRARYCDEVHIFARLAIQVYREHEDLVLALRLLTNSERFWPPSVGLAC
ncbi:MAG: hypothetical protein MHM6MM_004866 [Cercozoa sp. M6MM]